MSVSELDAGRGAGTVKEIVTLSEVVYGADAVVNRLPV
jgi:hypothetical protein